MNAERTSIIKAAVAVIAAGAAVYFVFFREPEDRAAIDDQRTASRRSSSRMQPAPDAQGGVAAPTIEFGTGQPLARKPGTLRLATYNLENLYDDQDDPALADQYEKDPGTKPDSACTSAAATMRKVDADIWALEEIESEAALRWFMDKYLKDKSFQYVASLDAGDGRGIEQAVISRFPIRDTQNWPHKPLEGTQPDTLNNKPNPDAGKPIVMHRSPLRVDILVPTTFTATPTSDGREYAFTMYVVHQKSGPGFEFWRAAEAKATTALIADFTRPRPDRNVVVLGDFNARPGDESVGVYLAAGFSDVFGDVPKADPKWQTHASNRIIDHILVNPAMKPEILPDSRFVLGTPVRSSKADWKTTPQPAGYASDHFPVVVDLLPVDNLTAPR